MDPFEGHILCTYIPTQDLDVAKCIKSITVILYLHHQLEKNQHFINKINLDYIFEDGDFLMSENYKGEVQADFTLYLFAYTKEGF